jgi:hypothetical protein
MAGNRSVVEAGGQHHPRLSPRAGLCLHPYAPVRARMRSVLSASPGGDLPDPSARPGRLRAVGGSMSLYRAGLKLAFFLPLGVAMPLMRAPTGFADVSSVFTRASRPGATH